MTKPRSAIDLMESVARNIEKVVEVSLNAHAVDDKAQGEDFLFLIKEAVFQSIIAKEVGLLNEDSKSVISVSEKLLSTMDELHFIKRFKCLSPDIVGRDLEQAAELLRQLNVLIPTAIAGHGQFNTPFSFESFRGTKQRQVNVILCAAFEICKNMKLKNAKLFFEDILSELGQTFKMEGEDLFLAKKVNTIRKTYQDLKNARDSKQYQFKIEGKKLIFFRPFNQEMADAGDEEFFESSIYFELVCFGDAPRLLDKLNTMFIRKQY